MERAIKDLCQFSDADLFEEVAAGIGHVIDAINEEAAKVLILLDAVRCPRNRPNERSRTLGYFYDHLAKGIYAKVSQWHPTDFAEVKCGVNDERREHYLDGPNGVDWIFPNSITQWREDKLYVGYNRGDSEEGNHWVPPRIWVDYSIEKIRGNRTPAVINLARAIHQAKATTPEGLSVVAEVWRPVDVSAEMRIDELRGLNRRTLEVLENRNLLSPAPNKVYEVIHDNWIFPLWPLDLQVLKVKKEELREVQRQWPDGY